jgi:hypothetical protein
MPRLPVWSTLAQAAAALELGQSNGNGHAVLHAQSDGCRHNPASMLAFEIAKRRIVRLAHAIVLIAEIAAAEL